MDLERIPLRFESIQKIVGSDDLWIILLTDEARRQALSVVCDDLSAKQILMRMKNAMACSHMLPEVLSQMLGDHLELIVVGVFDGQYQVVLMNLDTATAHRIRMSDAVLLHLIARVPLFIEKELMRQQSFPFDSEATGVSVPINTMDVKRLKQILGNAVEEENYELASQIRDELKRRVTK